MKTKPLKPTKELIKHCKKQGLNPEALEHMLFMGPGGRPVVPWAHLESALGRISFPQPCKICEDNRERWLNYP